MQKTLIRGGMALQDRREATAEFVSSKLGDERGEIGSWLILAAGLAIAAAAAGVALDNWIDGRVTDITSNTNGAS